MKKASFILLPLAVTSSLALAENALNEILVTGTRSIHSVEDSPITSYQIDANALRQQGLSDVIDALQRVPSLSVTQAGGRGTLAQIRIRGQEANHVLVLLDGMRLNDPVTGFADFANLRLNGIERIEVVPGAQSLIYGGDASGGVVHLISKSAESFALEADWTRGSNNLRERSAFANLSSGALSASIRHSKVSTDGISSAATWRGNPESDGYRSEQNHARVALNFDEITISYQQRNGGHFTAFDTDDYASGLPIDEPPGFNNAQRRNDEESMSSFTWDLDSQVTLAAEKSKGSYRSFTSSYSPGFPSYGIPAGMSPYDTQGVRERSSVYLSFAFENTQLTVGGDQTQQRVSTSYFSRKESKEEGVYLEWSANYDALFLNAGLRKDSSDDFGSETTYRAAFGYSLSERMSLKSSISTGFNPPTLFELYDFGGNPDLQAERSKSIDIGFDYQFNHGQTSVILFEQVTDNLIRSVGSFPSSRMENVDRSEVKGIELSVAWQLTHSLSSDFVATISKAREFKPNEQAAIRVPEQTASVSLDWEASDELSFGGSINYYSERTDYNWALATNTSLDAYTSGSAYARYELGSSITLVARIDNIWDERYEWIEGYGTPGRTALLRTELRF